jgi:UDP-glucose-4-epimerase GalE
LGSSARSGVEQVATIAVIGNQLEHLDSPNLHETKMNKTENAILVVGGAGYIGSHACKAIAAQGMLPVCFDNLSTGHREMVKWGPLVAGDLADHACLRKTFATYPISAVMHFAAHAYVGESVLKPALYYANNVVNTIGLLDCMRDANVRSIVFSSTCATYGTPAAVPIIEDHPQAPINPYGWSKLMVEQILKDYERAYGTRHAILRYFNAAGADPEQETGEWHDPETHLIPLILDVALGKRASIAVFGDDYPTEDGTCVRDYIHVTDLADAHLLALHKLHSTNESLICNLGNGRGFSVREVISSAERVTGMTIKTDIASRREGDPPILVGDATKARRFLGWNPRFHSIDTILETAWNWHKSINESVSTDVI